MLPAPEDEEHDRADQEQDRDDQQHEPQRVHRIAAGDRVVGEIGVEGVADRRVVVARGVQRIDARAVAALVLRQDRRGDGRRGLGHVVGGDGELLAEAAQRRVPGGGRVTPERVRGAGGLGGEGVRRVDDLVDVGGRGVEHVEEVLERDPEGLVGRDQVVAGVGQRRRLDADDGQEGGDDADDRVARAHGVLPVGG